jgi:site-specific DNA-methyltransferase (adenine-specific)
MPEGETQTTSTPASRSTGEVRCSPFTASNGPLYRSKTAGALKYRQILNGPSAMGDTALKKQQTISASPLSLYSRYAAAGAKGDIFLGDALSFLTSIENDTAAIVFLDPPFNLGKDYGNGKQQDLKPRDQYISWLLRLIRESQRILRSGGALYVYHLPSIATQLTGLLNELLQFRHWIAISMKNTFVRGERLYPAHYALLYYTKGPPAHFYRPKLAPLKCRRCNTYLKDYGGYRHIIERAGVNLSDIWDDISPVRHRNRKSRGANELPMKVLERIVAISGAPDELYVDPFAGGGNGVLAALRAGMRFASCDIAEDYCRLVSDRVKEAIKEPGRANHAGRKCQSR